MEKAVETGTVFARCRARGSESHQLIAGKTEMPAVGPFLVVERNILLGVKADGCIVLACIQEFCPQTHDGVCALLKVLMSHRYVKHGKLGLLIAFERAVEEMDGTVFFERNSTKPGRERVVIYCSVIAGWRWDGCRNGVGIGAGITSTPGAATKENYYH